jgi:CHAD domain-containing protein
MGKARPIEGLKAEDPYGAVAARVIDVRARELIGHARGVLDTSEIERLHDMRVATRRLRASLEIFEPCFPRRQFKSVLRDVKALADALGERRDRDVTIAALEDVAAAMPAVDRPGVNTLSESLRLEQAAANKALATFVSPERLALLEEQLSELLADAQPAPADADAAGPQGEVVELPSRDGASPQPDAPGAGA